MKTDLDALVFSADPDDRCSRSPLQWIAAQQMQYVRAVATLQAATCKLRDDLSAERIAVAWALVAEMTGVAADSPGAADIMLARVMGCSSMRDRPAVAEGWPAVADIASKAAKVRVLIKTGDSVSAALDWLGNRARSDNTRALA